MTFVFVWIVYVKSIDFPAKNLMHLNIFQSSCHSYMNSKELSKMFCISQARFTNKKKQQKNLEWQMVFYLKKTYKADTFDEPVSSRK